MDNTINDRIKSQIREEYVRRVKKFCRSKLNDRNLVSGINVQEVC